MATAQQLVVTELDQVNDGHLASGLVVRAALAGLVSDQRPQLVQVHRGAELVVLPHVEHSHTDLSEVAGMVFVHVDTVVVHTSSVTTTSGMLAVLAWKGTEASISLCVRKHKLIAVNIPMRPCPWLT